MFDNYWTIGIVSQFLRQNVAESINNPFAELSPVKLEPESHVLIPGVIDTLTAKLGALARRAETSETLLEQAVELVLAVLGARTVALYLCNTSSVALLASSGGEVKFVREAILFNSRGVQDNRLPDRVEFEGETGALVNQLRAVFSPKMDNSASNDPLIIPFFQNDDLRGALVICGAGLEINKLQSGLGQSFNEFSVMLELVTDRYLQKALVDLNTHCLTMLSDQPQQCMCGILKEASKMIGCDGISFFAIDAFDALDVSDSFHLVGTYPKVMPLKSIVYSKSDNTFTSHILYCSKDCVVHYTTLERSQLNGYSPAKWRDVPEQTRSRTVLYVRVIQSGETAALLRCTNRTNKKQPPWFNWVDIRRAKALASLLLPYYKAAQKEDRFANSLSDISHEIKTTTGSISYTVQNIRDQLQGTGSWQDVLLKLGHIDRAAKGLKKLLPALRMEAAIPSVDKTVVDRIAKGFRPYADLCKPIAEMHIQAARKRQCLIEHVGQDQLGFIYADIEDFKHIIQNLISNAVKYTNYGKPIYIRYQRPGPGGQFASIAVASESLTIRPEEVEFIFKFHQRSQTAKESGIEGEGLGLAIARAKAQQYKGDVIYRNHDRFNVFTLLIPRVLFQPPNEGEKK